MAELAGVSSATVSRVLNANYPVATETRARVLHAVQTLNYELNAHARALTTASSDMVGVVVHDVSDPYFSEIIRGVQQVADEAGRLIMICNSLRDASRELAYVRVLRRQRADAVILVGGAIGDEAYEEKLTSHMQGLEASNSRLIVCGRSRAGTASVNAQHAAGAEALTRRLLDLGHRRLAFIAGPAHVGTSRNRFRGFKRALATAGITPEPTLMAQGDFSRDGGYEAARRLLRGGERFTALVGSNDLMAIGAMTALRESGLEIPGDVSVVGFDDIPVARDVTPALTTVRVPMRLMGARAMELALQSDGRSRAAINLRTEIVERESMGAPGS
ncbi:MAG TPA: LacI family DNA-binding transcriptional regulator [Egibacteraceae bacterium]|nr:LacI family DNA-binding transcriptional regulator [Egibacteraceae bacterium]